MQSDDLAIQVTNLSKGFRLPLERNSTLKSLIVQFYKRRKGYEQQHVLRNISFDVKKGEFFGVVGRNGSGKSTLLKLLAGIYAPDKGLLEVRGSLTPFIELGVGFNPELTGRENVFLNGALLGFSRNQMRAMYDDIVEFAELGRFMDQKLKNYSSGMQVRLAFSIAIKVNSDILLLDEVLAVGDAAFQKKCFDYFRQLKKDRKTVVFISHDMNAVREYCTQAILIEKGKILLAGSAEEVAREYTRLFIEPEQRRQAAAAQTERVMRWGSGEAEITKVSTQVRPDDVTIEAEYVFHQDIDNPVFGLTITSPIGVKMVESNTRWKRIKTGSFKENERITVRWAMPNIFTNGTNYASVSVVNSDASQFFDAWDEAMTFTIDKDDITTAVTLAPLNVDIHKN